MLQTFIGGKNVLVSIPTGYGKYYAVTTLWPEEWIKPSIVLLKFAMNVNYIPTCLCRQLLNSAAITRCAVLPDPFFVYVLGGWVTRLRISLHAVTYMLREISLPVMLLWIWGLPDVQYSPFQFHAFTTLYMYRLSQCTSYSDRMQCLTTITLRVQNLTLSLKWSPTNIQIL